MPVAAVAVGILTIRAAQVGRAVAVPVVEVLDTTLGLPAETEPQILAVEAAEPAGLAL